MVVGKNEDSISQRPTYESMGVWGRWSKYRYLGTYAGGVVEVKTKCQIKVTVNELGQGG